MAARRYSSAVRAEQRRATRQRVLDAARALLLSRGYGGATIEAIARRAGVSVQTIYNTVGGKAAVLKAVYDTMLAGDDEPVPVMHMYRHDDGVLAEHWGVRDELSGLWQVGALPTPGPVALAPAR